MVKPRNLRSPFQSIGYGDLEAVQNLNREKNARGKSLLKIFVGVLLEKNLRFRLKSIIISFAKRKSPTCATESLRICFNFFVPSSFRN